MMTPVRYVWVCRVLMPLLMIGGCFGFAVPVAADAQTFPETGKTVSGPFLDYWRANGGLATFGLPITDAANETNAEDGKTYQTQWFERNRLELHPEIGNGTILLGLLGKDLRREALAVDPDFQRADMLVNAAQPREEQIYFQETGHNLRFTFLDYWNANGGLARFGYPIGEEHKEIDPETGKVFVMQWFERARFEFHPENRSGSQVLLGLLGKQIKAPKPGSVEFVWKIGRQGFNTLKGPRGVAVDKQGNVYVAETQSHRIQKFDSNGRFVARFGSPGSGDGQFLLPGAIAVDSQGNVFVADNGNARIQKFDANGSFLLKWGSKGAGDGQFRGVPDLAGPVGIATDASGNVYVIDADGDRVLKFDGNGRFLLTWGSTGGGNGQFGAPRQIAIDGQGNVYVSDTGTFGFSIQKFDGNGHFILRWGSAPDDHSRSDGHLYYPEGVAVDSQGNVFVADRGDDRVQEFDSNGQFLAKWGNAGKSNGEFRSIEGIAVDAQGNVYVADEDNNRIQKFDSGGHYLIQWGSGDADNISFDAVHLGPMAVDRQGNLFIADGYRIQKFDRAGHFLLQWGSEGKGDGQFTGVSGLAVDSQGNVYALDPTSYRVEKFDSNGKFLLKWGSQGAGDGQFDSYTYGIATDTQGSVYVTESLMVQKFDNAGQLLLKWGSRGAGDGQFAFASDIAVDGKNNVYVSDGRNQRIEKFDVNGIFLAKWSLVGADMTADSRGNVYLFRSFQDNDNKNALSVQQFDGNGLLTVEWGSYGDGDGQFMSRSGVVADGFGNIYISADGRVQKFRQR